MWSVIMKPGYHSICTKKIDDPFFAYQSFFAKLKVFGSWNFAEQLPKDDKLLVRMLTTFMVHMLVENGFKQFV